MDLENIMHIHHKKSADLLSEVLYMFKSQLDFTLFYDMSQNRVTNSTIYWRFLFFIF